MKAGAKKANEIIFSDYVLVQPISQIFIDIVDLAKVEPFKHLIGLM